MTNVTFPTERSRARAEPGSFADETADSSPTADPTTTLMQGPGPPSGLPAAGGVALSRGDCLDQYIVLSCLGSGGMGIVYAAYDPDLDRKVAIKLLRPRSASGSADSPGAGRVSREAQREAQALAKLSHPNVVAIYHTGWVGQQVFIAMELVPGSTLRRWSKAEPRTWREVLAVYCQAGRGLAAAHAAGLVHRDFKPSNAILGADGRVRVLDFGLAQRAPRPDPAADPRANESLLEPVFGTAPYMAPEQLAGRPVDARSDQYSFCRALYEGLFGSLPRHGEEASALETRGEEGARIPHWLRRAVLRGLEAAPEDRYPTMDDLLEQLEQEPGRRRQRLLAAAAVVFLGLAGLAGSWWGPQESTICRGAEGHLAGIWNDAVRGQMQRAFAASRVRYADASWQATSRALDRYTASWTAMHTSACEATHVRGEQSSALLDLRMACLQDRLREVEAATELLRHDGAAVAKAVELVSDLRPLDGCADAERLTARVELPDDPETGGRVAAIRDVLARANALRLAGRYGEALELAQSTSADGDRVGYAPLLAEIRYQIGRLQLLRGAPAKARSALFDAWQQAEIGRHVEMRVEALFLLAWIAAAQDRTEDSDRWLTIADGVIQGSGEVRFWRNRWHYYSARSAQVAGRYGPAADHALQAVEGARAMLGADHVTVAQFWSALGGILLLQGKDDEARDKLLEAERIRRQTLGPGHPLVGETDQALGRIALEQGGFDEAERRLRRALEVAVSQHGEEAAPVAMILHDLGLSHLRQGQYDRALEVHHQALTIWTDRQDSYRRARTLNLIGVTQARAGRLAEAEEPLTQALRLAQETKGEEHPGIAYFLTSWSEFLSRAGRPGEARRPLERARRLNPAASVQGETAAWLGQIDLETGDFDRARQYLEEAVARIGPEEPLLRAEVGFALARVLWRQGQAPERALALAEEAWGGFLRMAEAGAGAGESVSLAAARVERWLKPRRSAKPGELS